jgi:hypothetical protein
MYKSLRAQTLHYFARPHERVPDRPLDGPAAWRGAQMRQRNDWSIQLNASEIAEAKAAVATAQATGKPMNRLSREDAPLPTLAPRIAQWRQEIRHGRGFVLIRGLPVHEWTEAQAEIFYWCLGHHLGIPGAQNPEGDLLGHVRDQRTGEDVRYYRGEGGIKAFPIAPCAYANGELRTFWQSDYYRSAERIPHVPRLSAEEKELLDTYDGIAGEPEFYLDMELQPGDIQLISNHTILHARTAFEDWPEPERRRHLLRLWISLPEKRPLKSRWLAAQSWAQLTFTAIRELARNRLTAQGQ